MDSSSTQQLDDEEVAHRGRDWLSWLLGAAVLGGVIAAALHFSEAEAFLRLAEQAQPWWLGFALLAQASTYVLEGEVWRLVARVSGFKLGMGRAYQLSLSKLFLDQAVPSAGLSGTLAVAHELARSAMPRSTVTAAVVVRLVSYYAAYALTLAASLLIATLNGQANTLVALVAVLFVGYALAFSGVVLALSGRKLRWPAHRMLAHAHIRKALQLLEEVDPALARNPGLLAHASVLQLGIIALDVATVWMVIQSLGVNAPPLGVFASVVLSNLFRSIGILPGGLGSFEAASVLSLKMIGVPVAVALAATLIFRGLSFWLPMLPGFWCSRRLVAR
jgi:Mg2+-importing ATPase